MCLVLVVLNHMREKGKWHAPWKHSLFSCSGGVVATSLFIILFTPTNMRRIRLLYGTAATASGDVDSIVEIVDWIRANGGWISDKLECARLSAHSAASTPRNLSRKAK